MEVRGIVYLILAFLVGLFILGLILFFTGYFILFSAVVCITLLVVLGIAIVVGILIIIFALPYYAITKSPTIMPGDYTIDQVKDMDEDNKRGGEQR